MKVTDWIQAFSAAASTVIAGYLFLHQRREDRIRAALCFVHVSKNLSFFTGGAGEFNIVVANLGQTSLLVGEIVASNGGNNLNLLELEIGKSFKTIGNFESRDVVVSPNSRIRFRVSGVAANNDTFNFSLVFKYYDGTEETISFSSNHIGEYRLIGPKIL